MQTFRYNQSSVCKSLECHFRYEGIYWKGHLFKQGQWEKKTNKNTHGKAHLEEGSLLEGWCYIKML